MSRHESRSLTLLIREPLVRGTGVLYDDMAVRAADLRVDQTAMGGHWALTFSLTGQQTEIEDWVDDGLGRHVELYDTNLRKVWEGFVNRVSANIGSLALERGPLLEAANRICVAYSTVDTTTDPPTTGIRDNTLWNDNANSQAKYGIIERVISVAGTNAATAAQFRDVALYDLREPPTDETENLGQSSEASATVECLGYYHWLGAYTVDLTTTGLQDADAKLQAVLNADPNGIFSTNYDYVDSNTTQVGAYDRDMRTALNVVQGLVAVGDAAFNRWLFGFREGRQAFYHAIPTATDYQRALSDPPQRLETFGNASQVFPWDAEAGRWLFYTDLLIGKTAPADRRTDPRYLFVEQMTYTAPWALTLRGGKTARLAQLLSQKGLGGTHA